MPNADIVVGAQLFGSHYPAVTYIAESTIFKGDFLKKNAAGTVERAAATNPVVGVALSDASAGQECLVADHPDQLFMIQADDATIDAQTDIGLNYDIVVAAANTAYKRSGMELDASSQVTTATAVLRLIKVVPAPDNELGNFTKCVVRINNHQNGSSTGVAGV
jgi:hypothetical protein